MKHKKIFFSSLIIIVAAAAVITIAQTSYAAAANDNAASRVNRNGQMNKHGEFAYGSKMGNKSNTVSQADREKRQAAVDAALQASDYNAWVQAVGENSPILSKINASNFPKFVQAHQLRKQANAIMTELGLDQGMRYGMLGVQNIK